MTLKETLEKLYRLEINCEISSFWDGGWTYRLGDRVNGFKAEDGYYEDLDDCVQELWSAALRLYPKIGDALES